MIFAIVYGAVAGLILYFEGKTDEKRKTRMVEFSRDHWRDMYERTLEELVVERAAKAPVATRDSTPTPPPPLRGDE